MTANGRHPISNHISYREATNSTTAIRLGIENHPDEATLKAMQRFAECVFEPVREFVGGPLYISSFYRSILLNRIIGGSSRSQHCKGEAMDIDAQRYGGRTNAELFQFIKENLSFDQLIWEFGNDNEPDWIHISYVTAESNRNMVLKAIKKERETHYISL